MKKVISVLLALLLVTGIFAGCGKDNATETTAVETTEEETTTTAPVLTDEQVLALSADDFWTYLNSMKNSGLPEDEFVQKKAELTAKLFLNYIKNKKVDDIAVFIETGSDVSTGACSIFNEIDVDSYEYVAPYYSSYDGQTNFNVTLHISKSNSELFPVGTSRWILSTGEGMYGSPINYFRRANEVFTPIKGDSLGNAVDFCYDVSNDLGCFETMDNFNKLITDAQSNGSIGWFGEYLVTILLKNRDGYYSDSAYPVKMTELETLAKKTFGITNIDFYKEISKYNSSDDTIDTRDGHGGAWRLATLHSSNYDSSTRIRTIVIDFYSDNAYSLKSKTMEYTLRVNQDDSLTLLSTRLLYDSGYNMILYGT